MLAAGSVRAPIYAAIVREKLGWIGAPSQALLQANGDRRRVNAFLHAHDLFLVGLQAIDDVIDTDEDRALRGADVPSALRCSPGALMRAAPKLRAAGRAGGRDRRLHLVRDVARRLRGRDLLLAPRTATP